MKRYTIKYKALHQSIELWKYLFLRLIVKRFESLYHDLPGFDIFGNVTAQIGVTFEGWDFMQSLAFFNIFSGNPYFDALNK